MSTFQLIMFVASAYFAFRIYQHIQSLNNHDIGSNQADDGVILQISEGEDLVDQADEEFAKGDLKKALELLEMANSSNRYDPYILFKLGFVLDKLDRSDEALRYLNDAIEVDSSSVPPLNVIASIYRKRGDFESAREYLIRSIELDNANKFTFYNYGNLLVDMELYDEAKSAYARALEIDPSFSEASSELEKLTRSSVEKIDEDS
ncbi:MAG: tetratricopeptide repeat protein [Sulfuricurvum sp.]